MVRAFIAIELPTAVKDRLHDIQEELKKSGADVKWVNPENIHLTLKFLGDQDNKTIEKISQITEETLTKIQRYTIRLSTLGAFPRIESPRVLWVGIDTGDAQTKEIANLIEDRIATLGLAKEERDFSSHITIGRIKGNTQNSPLSRFIKALEKKPQEYNLGFEVNKVILFKSTLSAGGPIYEPIKEVILKAT